MEKIKEFQLGKNKTFIILLNLASLALFILFFYLFSFLARYLESLLNSPTVFMVTPLSILTFLVSIIGILFIHEGIHGLFFKIFAPQRPVKFGFHGYALSASSPQTKYSKGKYLWIGLAPFVLISLGLTLATVVSWINPITFVLLASMHGAGCIGDFYMAFLVVKEKGHFLVEDTSTGMIFYRQ